MAHADGAPVITVCVPVYNGARFVAETLRSALAQTFGAIRVLISVEPSADSSLAICRRFESDPRVRVIAQPERGGWVENTNHLIRGTETDYYCILPQDDLINPGYLEVLHEHLLRHPRAVCSYSDLKGFGDGSQAVGQVSLTGPPTRRIVTFLLGRMAAVAFRGLIARRRLPSPVLLRHNAAGDFAADTIWMLELACAGELRRIEGILYAKRLHKDSETMRWAARAPRDRLEGWVEHCVQCANIALEATHGPGDRACVMVAAVERFRERLAQFAAAADAGFLDRSVRHAAWAGFHARTGIPRDLFALAPLARASEAGTLLAANLEDAGRPAPDPEAPSEREEEALESALANHAGGGIDKAKAHYREAMARDPGNAAALHFLGIAEVQQGRTDEGIRLIKRSIELRPDSATFHLNLGTALRQANRLDESVRALRTALAINPRLAAAFRQLAAGVALGVARDAGPRSGPAPAGAARSAVPDLSLSVVTCSRDDSKRSRIRAHYEDLLAGRRFEIIQMQDARSLAEAYNRGFAQSSGDIVIFSHDDIEILSEDFAGRLLRQFADCDLVGTAGTTRLAGPSWVRAYWPHVHGCVVHPAASGGFTVEWYGPPCAAGAQAIDGFFFAATRALCEAVPFDAATFDGFHLYDLDFSYRAHLAGFRTRVCSDVLVLHQSVGRYDALWRRYADRFMEKHSERLAAEAPVKKRDWATLRFATRPSTLEFHRRMQDILRDLPRVSA